MACENKGVFYTFSERTYQNVPLTFTCGQYMMLEQRFCDDCLEQKQLEYPQGWDTYPGERCPHGTYVGGVGIDYMCPICESI